MATDALAVVDVNTVTDVVGQDATPQKPIQKFKRKQIEDEYTPRSRHVDKRIPAVTPAQMRQTAKSSQTDEDEKTKNVRQGLATIQLVGKSPVSNSSSEDVFSVTEEKKFDGSSSVGSILSQPDFSASVIRAASDGSLSTNQEADESSNDGDPEVEYYKAADENVPTTPMSGIAASKHGKIATPDEKTPVQRTVASTLEARSMPRNTSPSRTPRLRDFQVPLTTPRSIVESAMRGHNTAPDRLQEQLTNTDMPKTPRFSETETLDLLSFQTPAPRRPTDAQSQLRRFTSADGEEMLLDITPRVYSPRSIPIYTLRDLDQIKAEFEKAREELEARVQHLHQELASSVSHANHHKALSAQAESLHAEYSKKHVRKVTALKTDWERKTTARIAQKDEVIAEHESTIAGLKAALQQERDEKKEVIQMAEAVLALQQQ